MLSGNDDSVARSGMPDRENIREFFLGLDESERKNLLKLEKDAVMKKMKESQKHGCSCGVCGRKRHAIEEELEVLYEAYYTKLEEYAKDRGINLLVNPHQVLPSLHRGRTKTLQLG